MAGEIRLNLGAGSTVIEGFTPIDRKLGSEVYPLADYADNSVAEIRASHILEHFSQAETLPVLDEWVRVLKPGGAIKIAVPNWSWVTDAMFGGKETEDGAALLEAYLLGGQTDADDFHRSLWTLPKLIRLLEAAGLERLARWRDAVKDCAALDVSLNLEGTKPAGAATENPEVATCESTEAAPAGPANPQQKPRVCAVMSVPRLGFMDNMFCAVQAFAPLRIPLKHYTGAFWGQCLTRCLEEAIDEGFDLIFTLDYDTIFTRDDVLYMIKTMMDHPEFDALCGAQMKRDINAALLTMSDANGDFLPRVPVAEFQKEFTQARSAHFGLTALRAAKVKDLPRPWFLGRPGPDGRWDDGRLDADMAFWQTWREAGNTLVLANRVRLGHLELMINWPTKDFEPHFQRTKDFHKTGRPEEANP